MQVWMLRVGKSTAAEIGFSQHQIEVILNL